MLSSEFEKDVPNAKINYTVDGKNYSIDVASWVDNALWLFPIMYPQYTSWPFGKPDIKEDEDSDDASSVLSEGQYLMNIGRYRLYVKDGKKYLFL